MTLIIAFEDAMYKLLGCVCDLWHFNYFLIFIHTGSYVCSGSPLWLLLNMAPIRNEKDQVILILCTFKDITALKQPIEDENARGKGKLVIVVRVISKHI